MAWNVTSYHVAMQLHTPYAYAINEAARRALGRGD